MPNRKLSWGWRVVAVVFAAIPFATVAPARAQQESLLHQFDVSDKDAYFPYDGLIFDRKGNLYGTTSGGGVYGEGAVFELSPKGGVWKERLVHSFDKSGIGGYSPYGALVMDGAGNLYGTTAYGGAHGGGTVFEFSPQTNDRWSAMVLHQFDWNSGDGIEPKAGLTFDKAGNLYGTTAAGGANDDGSVFELSPAANGAWTETVLHSFDQDGTDGFIPICGLVFDSRGNLYGTTTNGGAYAWGTVFALSPAAGGTWNETILHNFDHSASDGFYPDAGLITDAKGNLYGTASQGGAYGGGIVFEITP